MQLPKPSATNPPRHAKPYQCRQRLGCDHSEVAQTIAQTVGYVGQIEFDTPKPVGTLRKWMKSSRLDIFGWKTKVDLHNGLGAAYQDFVSKL